MTGEKNRVEWPKKPSWSVVVVYEDVRTRQQAVGFCERLIQRYWGHCGFEMTWVSLGELEDGASASRAAQNAAGGDLLIFSFQPEGDLALTLRAWVEVWLKGRGEREGAVVGLARLRGFEGGERENAPKSRPRPKRSSLQGPSWPALRKR